MSENDLGITVRLGAVAFDDAIARATAALKAEGFGIISDIDVKKTMKEKLGVDGRPYRILGACNPPIAHAALEADPMIGLLLPCNVIVFEGADAGITVSIANPCRLFELVETPGVEKLVESVYEKLCRAAQAMQG